MPVLFMEMTRDELNAVAPEAIAVLPTAAIEQHGPHMATGVDTILVSTVAQRAAEKAAGRVPVVVAPTLPFGSSHHHYAFGGTISYTAPNFIGSIQDILEGLVRCGFRKLVVLNGHGGNSDHVGVVGQDLVNRLDHPVAVATGNYWNIAKPALLKKNLLPAGEIPGHAGRFETSLMLALRPDLVREEIRQATTYASPEDLGLDVDLAGAMVQVHGTWGKGPGHTDHPATASAELGEALLEVMVDAIAEFYVGFGDVPGAQQRE